MKFPESEEKRIILLNGTSSSGKSSISKHLKEIIGAQVVALDDFIPENLDDPLWEDDVYELMPEMCSRIKALLSNGSKIIVDHVITSERIYDMLLSAAGEQNVFKVLVSCDVEVMRARERSRGNRYQGAAEITLEYLYPKTGYDLCIDTAVLNPLQSAERIALCSGLTNGRDASEEG